MGQICNFRVQSHRAGKWQEGNCLAVSVGGLGGQEPCAGFQQCAAVGRGSCAWLGSLGRVQADAKGRVSSSRSWGGGPGLEFTVFHAVC